MDSEPLLGVCSECESERSMIRTEVPTPPGFSEGVIVYRCRCTVCDYVREHVHYPNSSTRVVKYPRTQQ